MNPIPVPPNLNPQPQFMPRPANPVSVIPTQISRNPMTMTDRLAFVQPSTSSHQLPPVGPADAINRLQPIIHSSTPYILSSSPPRHTNVDNHTIINGYPQTQTTHAPTPTETTCGLQSQIQSVVPRNHHQGNRTGPEPTNLPASSLPTPSSDSTSSCGSIQRPRTGRLDTIVHHEPAQSVLASLSDAASIYNLPTSTLERVVGEVIREEGFLQLVSFSELNTPMTNSNSQLHQVERLSEMFTIRKVANV